MIHLDYTDKAILDAVRRWLEATTLAPNITDDGVVRYLLWEWWSTHKDGTPSTNNPKGTND